MCADQSLYVLYGKYKQYLAHQRIVPDTNGLASNNGINNDLNLPVSWM